MAKPDTLSHETGAHQISIKVDNAPVITSIEKMMDEFPPQSPDYCIYRVPKKFRDEVSEKLFIPQLVSVGPFHHGAKELQDMEEHKPAYLRAFLDRSNMRLEDGIKLIKDWENKIRNCYTEQIKLSCDDFVKMVLLDSCFVIEVMYRREVIPRNQRTDYLSRSTMISDVRTDLTLLENQLPFFVLEGLYNLAFQDYIANRDKINFRTLCLRYFEKVMLIKNSEEILRTSHDQHVSSEIKHILDLLRIFHAHSDRRQTPEDSDRQLNRMRKATELEEAGMVIKQSRNDRSVADISYSKGVLEIPKIILHTAAEHLLRNLLAFDRCHYQHSPDVTDYLHFLDDLIDTGEDVDVLIRKGIVENFLSDSNAVATLINNLQVQFHSRRYYYTEVRDEINKYCEVPWHKWRATLKRDYFSSPWIVASTIAAGVLLILTVIQTVCSVISIP